MIIGVPTERAPEEKRVALSPSSVAGAIKLGFKVNIQAGAGIDAGFSDREYEEHGAEVISSAHQIYQTSDVLLKIRPPLSQGTENEDEFSLLRPGQTLISLIGPGQNPDLLNALAKKGITALAMDAVPRISRAQKLDTLSSMANVAGYRAVVEAATHFGRFFTGQVTAAGKVPPAKVLVIGAGVAGLAAIGAATAMGAVVRAFDTRPEVKEQVESMGAEFLMLDFEEEGSGEGGYAKVMSESFLEAEMKMFAEQAIDVLYDKVNLLEDALGTGDTIEEAINNPKANVKNKTWRYRGEIYLNISRDSALFAAYPQALSMSKDSYFKAKELDTKGSYSQEIQIGLGQVQMAASNAGIQNYNAKEFDRAGSMFDLAAEIAFAFDAVDTMAVFNSALCYENAGNLELAVARYETCAEIGYQVPNVYLFISSLYRDAGREDDALNTLAHARGLYPREQSLIIEELNIYLTNEEFDKAKENLSLAAEQDPTNEILWFSLGSVLDNLGNSEEAIDAYLKALEVKADYFDANYNLGALYFNQAVQGINKANDPIKAKVRLKALSLPLNQPSRPNVIHQ